MRKSKSLVIYFIVLALFGNSLTAVACTSVVLGQGDRVLLGQNYDFAYTHGAIFVNASGKKKQALVDKGDLSMKWESRYSSVVFSQFGRELPTSGMNEKGLTIQLLWNEDGVFPEVDAKTTPTLGELSWVQYQLDTAMSVKEVVDSFAHVAIKKAYADLHYIVCEASGDCALLEYENNELRVYHRGDDFRPAVITNSSLINSKKFYSQFRDRALSDIPKKKKSLNVYARTAWLVENGLGASVAEKPSSSDMFSVLSEAKLDYEFTDMFRWIFSGQPPSITAWSAVFSPSGRWIEFRSHENQKVRRIELTKLFRKCDSPDLAMNLDDGTGGEINSFFDSNAQRENLRIIRASYEPIRNLAPRDVQDALFDYAESHFCGEGKRP